MCERGCFNQQRLCFGKKIHGQFEKQNIRFVLDNTESRMWYEILPGLAIFAGCLSAVGVVNIGFQKLGNGGKLRRVASNHFEYRLLRRDEMIAGKGYYSKGLEALPDVPLTKN